MGANIVRYPLHQYQLKDCHNIKRLGRSYSKIIKDHVNQNPSIAVSETSIKFKVHKTKSRMTNGETSCQSSHLLGANVRHQETHEKSQFSLREETYFNELHIFKWQNKEYCNAIYICLYKMWWIVLYRICVLSYYLFTNYRWWLILISWPNLTKELQKYESKVKWIKDEDTTERILEMNFSPVMSLDLDIYLLCLN